LLFSKVLFEGIGDLVHAELVGQRDEIPIRGDLVMFGFLASGDVVPVENVLVRILFRELLVVFDQSVDRAVGFGLG
jgi:hypothetical protein